MASSVMMMYDYAAGEVVVRMYSRVHGSVIDGLFVLFSSFCMII